MKTTYLFIILVTYSSVCFAQTGKEYDAIDQAELNDLPAQWQHYWNIHDMDSMGTLLDKNVDFVNVAGVWLRGRSETISDHKQKHKGIVFKNSIWKTDSAVIKYVKPDIAVIHVCWNIRGDNDPDGTPRKPRHGVFTWVVTKEYNHWKILAAQNTNKREPNQL